MRYIVITAAKAPPLDEDVVAMLRSHWERAAQAHNSVVESLEVAPCYVQVTLLTPIDVAPHDIVHGALMHCVEAGVALHEGYFITNTGEPNEEEIEAVLKELTTDTPSRG